MVEVVSNATPLIYLSKIRKLHLLKVLFERVFITPEIKREVVDVGKKMGVKDAYFIEKAIHKGLIEVRKSQHVKLPLKLHEGEASTISLALKLNVKFILMDETKGRTVSKLMGLKPLGTVYVLMKLLKNHEIDFDEFLNLLNSLIEEGFRLREEVFIRAVREARRISGR